MILVSIYCLHTTLTHDLHIFSPIPGVNGKLTQKLTHQLHIFLSSLCQFTNYTIIDTLLTHFLLNLVSICKLHKKLTHYWHIFYWIMCQFANYTKIDSFLTRFRESLPLASIFQGCQNVSKCVKYVNVSTTKLTHPLTQLTHVSKMCHFFITRAYH